MSSDAIGWVFRHSPAKDKTFVVHAAIADSVNDQHENEFWMAIGNLAVKARVSRGTAQRAVGWLTDHDLIEIADENPAPWKSGKPVRYRFLFPDVPVIFETRGSRTMRDLGASPRATRSRTMRDPDAVAPLPIGTQDEPNACAADEQRLSDEDSFEHFWTAWPARNGKKLNRAKAFAAWRRISYEEKKAAWRGARNYAAASDAGMQGAMDAFRWLRDRLWSEWQTPATPTRARNGTTLDPVADLFTVEFDDDGKMIL